MDYAPVIFFSVEGEIKDYILHMDPIRLKGEKSFEIVPNVNLPQAISLILSGKNNIEGQVRIKHLNEFIDEPIKVSISKKYLLERYFLNRGVQNFKMSSLSSKEKDEMGRFVEKMISNTGPYADWEKVLWQEEGNNIERKQMKSMEIGKVKMNKNQKSIVDSVAPDLLKYNDRLYDLMEVLVKDFNKEIEEKNILRDEKQKLIDEVKDLEKIIDEYKANMGKLENEINLLEKDRKNLDSRIRDLKADNDKLYNELRYLEDDNLELYNIRRDFGISNGDLYDYIRYLEDKSREKVNVFVPVESEKTQGTFEGIED